MLQAPLLETKVGHSLLDGWFGDQREVGGAVAEVFAKACHQRGEEERVGDRELQVAKLVGEGLEAQTEVVDGEVVLMEAKEFLLEEAEALGLVVGEEAGDLGPDGVRGVIVTDDGVESWWRWSRRTSDDGGIDGQPVGVVGHVEEVDGAGNVIQ
jgi:hypothetical protein